jgi:hypothetical protein
MSAKDLPNELRQRAESKNNHVFHTTPRHLTDTCDKEEQIGSPLKEGDRFRYLVCHTSILASLQADLLKQGVHITTRNSEVNRAKKGRPWVSFKCQACVGRNNHHKKKPDTDTDTDVPNTDTDVPNSKRRCARTKRVSACPFCLTIKKYSEKDGRWYWKVHKLNTEHKGHETIKWESHKFTDDEVAELASMKFKHGMSTSSMLSILRERMQIATSQNVLNKLRAFRKEQTHNSSDELVKSICSDPDLIAAMRFRVVSKQTAQELGVLDLVRVPGYEFLFPTDEKQYYATQCSNIYSSADWAKNKSIFQALKNSTTNFTSSTLPVLHGNTHLQLDSIMWNTISQAKLINRFPELMQIDPTAKTNDRNVPMMFIAGADGNKNTILWSTSFLGRGEIKESFTWSLDALTSLYGVQTLLRVALSLSDGDIKITEPIDIKLAANLLGGTYLLIQQ